MAATGGDEAVAPPTSSKAPPVAGKARRRGALIEANILGLSERRMGSIASTR
ncbi:hypothetical protein [Thalassoglobus neptunius]|uniref:hypothetical protein n=1 Tax=Thalassoglobus neptunius TaxID=1938619 RepID=UPI0018D26036|nr:hypothetical protein [Thalassoglobus neptunius]